MTEFLDLCDYVLAHAEPACAGNLSEDLNDYRLQLEKAIDSVVELKKAQNGGPSSLWLQKKYSDLIGIKERIIAKDRTTSIRFAPIGFSLSGPTSVGKSTLSELTMRTSLYAMGFACTRDRTITLDQADKYQSTYTSDINGVYMDDFANTKSKFEEVAPTSYVIKFFNNVAAQAIKAEISAKGVVFINFKCGVITTNTKELDVRQYSNCPESILRRFYHVTVSVLPKYRRNGAQLNSDHPDLVDGDITKNVWSLNIEEVITSPTDTGMLGKKASNESSYDFRVVEIPNFKGQAVFVCKDLDLRTYLEVVVYLSQRHKRAQTMVVSRSDALNSMEHCVDCKLVKQMCYCANEPHSLDLIGDLIISATSNVFYSYWQRWIAPARFLNWALGWKYVREWQTHELEAELHRMMDSVFMPAVIAAIPQCVFDIPIIQSCLEKWQYGAAFLSVPRLLYRYLYLYVGFLCIAYIFGIGSVTIFICSFITFVIAVFLTALGWRARYREVHNEFVMRRQALPVHVKKARDKYIPGVAFLALGVAVVYFWNEYRKRVKYRSICPNSLTSPDVVDSKPSWQGYFKQMFGGKVDTDERMKNATISQAEHTLEKNLFFCEFERDDQTTTRCNILFPRKCVALFPHHIFYKNCDMSERESSFLKLKITRKPNASSSVFFCTVSIDQVVIFPECDMVMAYIPDCPDIKDMLKWLPKSKPIGNAMAKFMARDRECRMHSERIHVTFCDTGHKYGDFYGGTYTTSLAVKGACMGLILADMKQPCVVGVHIGGVYEKRYGVMQSFTIDEFNDALGELRAKPGVILSSLAGDIPQTQYGLPLITSPLPHSNAKAVLDFEPHAAADVIGSTRLRSAMKSQVQSSILSDVLFKVTGVPNVWGKPKLEPNYIAYNASLHYIVNPARMHIPQHLERARKDWMEPLMSAMSRQSKKFGIKPLTFKEMVLGRDGVRFLDPVPMNTSMGFPVFGPKSKYFDEVRHGEVLIDRIPDQSILTEMDRLISCWEQGYRAYPVVSATLKDEPTPVVKDKVRVFEAVPIALGLYIRKYFLPIARFLSLNPLLSESAVGVNSFSPDWDELMTFVETYNSEELMGWDYSKYDLRMNSQMTRAVLLSYIELAQQAGYDRYSLHIMEQMVNDIVHPLMDYNGTMLMVYNMNTSGNNITVNINSTANSLYVRMCFYDIYPHARGFREACSLMTYGDDGIASVNSEYDKFHIQSFIDYMGKHDMKVTLPTKEDRNDVKFIAAEDLDFLKRKSYYIPEINCRIGQLDEMSIFKSLHCNLKSKVCTDMEVAVATMESAMHEWFAFGREHYNMRMEQMQKVCDELKVPVMNAFVPFDDRVVNWIEKYRAEHHYIEPHSDDYSSDALCFGESRNHYQQDNNWLQALMLTLFSNNIPENNDNERSFRGTRRHGESLRKLEQFLEVDSSTYFEYALYTSMFTVGLILAALCTSKSNQYDVPEAYEVDPQADEVEQYTDMPAPPSEKVQNVVFEDSRPGYMEIKDNTIDSIRNAPLKQDASLKDFFSRPIKVATYRWGVGNGFFQDLNPWSLFFNNKRVVNRVANFKLMHAKLHVKFVISGTPFHYGRLLVSYLPLHTIDDMTRLRSLVDLDVISASQRPHIYLNPTSSIGGEMELPFFWPKNLLDTTYSDWNRLGSINIRQLQNLKHANGAVDTVTVSVFVWAEDVQLAIPTQYNPDSISPQADEYGSSPVSQIASSVANAMGMLSTIPTISPFARATEIGARAIAGIAKLYGYSKPPILTLSNFVGVNKYQFATVNTPDNVHKLSIDAKQELSVDPRLAGLDSTDELALLNIVKRESWIYSFQWNIGDLEETLLWNAVVDPCLFRAVTLGTDRELHFPACCFGTMPFQYWRGSMKFRFQVVCSNFHRGRIKVVYDPTGTSVNAEYNVAYTTIVDISEQTDFSIDVGWGQPYTFSEHIDPTTTESADVISNTRVPYTNILGYGNGTISVYVVNDLTVPDTTINNDILVNVFISMNDDFEVAGPQSKIFKRLRLTPPPTQQALAAIEVEPQSEECVDYKDSIPVRPESLAMMAGMLSTADDTDKAHFGERIVSYRQLLKRYDWFEYVRLTLPGALNSYSSFWIRRNMFPYYPGYYSNAVPSITTTYASGEYAPSNMTLMNYITCAFGGWKGGIRYTYDMTTFSTRASTVISRGPIGAPEKGALSVNPTSDVTFYNTTVPQIDSYMSTEQGSMVNASVTAPWFSFEVPYYAKHRFAPARRRVAQTLDDGYQDKFTLFSQAQTQASPNGVGIMSYVAGAEDFTCHFFLGAPVFFYEANRPS